MNNLIAIRQTDADTIKVLLERAKSFREHHEPQTLSAKERRTIGLLFFEESTRTRVGFEQAAWHLGHRSVTFSGAGSSMKKGETLKDTVITLQSTGLEGLVVRHRAAGACHLVASQFNGPVVNAGDGCHEHPTQALGDGLTVLLRKGRIQGLKVAIVGDVAHSRVARSNTWLFSKLGAEVRLVGPRTLMPTQTSGLPANVYHDLRAGIADADVVMALRLQRERMEEGVVSVGEYRRLYQINRVSLRSAAPDVLVMHPGPLNRGVEIDDATADGPQSAISEQVTNCMFGRMAALQYAFTDPAGSGQA